MLGGTLVVAGVACGAWQAEVSRDSLAAHLCVASLIGAAAVTTLSIGRGRQRRTSTSWLASAAQVIGAWRQQSTLDLTSVVVWFSLVAATVGWDAFSFMHQQHALPTLSYFVGHLSKYAAGRGALFAVWLAIGSYVVGGWRTRARQR
jgi:hypothetical protein